MPIIAESKINEYKNGALATRAVENNDANREIRGETASPNGAANGVIDDILEALHEGEERRRQIDVEIAALRNESTEIARAMGLIRVVTELEPAVELKRSPGRPKRAAVVAKKQETAPAKSKGKRGRKPGVSTADMAAFERKSGTASLASRVVAAITGSWASASAIATTLGIDTKLVSQALYGLKVAGKVKSSGKRPSLIWSAV